MNAPEKISLEARVGPQQAGMRLDQAAAELFPDFSRGRLQKWIRSGDLAIPVDLAFPVSAAENQCGFANHGEQRIAVRVIKKPPHLGS